MHPLRVPSLNFGFRKSFSSSSPLPDTNALLLSPYCFSCCFSPGNHYGAIVKLAMPIHESVRKIKTFVHPSSTSKIWVKLFDRISGRKYSTCARRRKPWWEGNTSITCAQRSVGKTSAIINEAIEAGEWKRRVRFGSSRMVNEVFCSLLLAKRLKQANASSSLHKFLPLMVIVFTTFYIRCSVWKRRVPILVIFTPHPSLQLPTNPSPNPTLTLTCYQLTVVELGEG